MEHVCLLSAPIILYISQKWCRVCNAKLLYILPETFTSQKLMLITAELLETFFLLFKYKLMFQTKPFSYVFLFLCFFFFTNLETFVRNFSNHISSCFCWRCVQSEFVAISILNWMKKQKQYKNKMLVYRI